MKELSSEVRIPTMYFKSHEVSILLKENVSFKTMVIINNFVPESAIY